MSTFEAFKKEMRENIYKLLICILCIAGTSVTNMFVEILFFAAALLMFEPYKKHVIKNQ